jgi:glycosyltransferase involved in cell wall biosynthesis
VIVIDDGSNDQTPTLLAEEANEELSELVVITLPENRGKAAAIRAGFSRAESMGFTHAITMDADGQHPVEALPEFGRRCFELPEALIIGVRDLKAARAPWERRISNALSTFWFKLETGVPLSDTQCGFRVYPLAALRRLRIKSDRYAYELEVLVKAAWAGIPLKPCPVQADYDAPTSRLSHFHPLRDFLQVAQAHARLLKGAVRMRVR